MKTFQPSKFSMPQRSGSALPNRIDIGALGAGTGAVVAVAGVIAFFPFVVVPLIIKPFKPEWSYGKRVAAGFAFSLGVSALSQVGKAFSGKES